MERRLSAILIADMVGYSRLMERDETGTIARQKAHRSSLIDPAFREYGGRIVKTTGDGLLAEFPSVVDAVQCAVKIQRKMRARESDQPEDVRIRYRIGINLGDVVHQSGDLVGDGVNVAARLEQMAEPGGICISGTVYDQLHSTIDAGYLDLGEVHVKNISRPIRAWRMLLDPSKAGQVVAVPQKRRKTLVLISLALACLILIAGVWWLSDTGTVLSRLPSSSAAFEQDRSRLVVLPFTSLSTDPGHDHLAVGMTEDLQTDLSKMPGILVIGRNMYLTGEASKIDPVEVARELGAHYLVTGSVRQAGGRLRINAQLLDMSTRATIWAERYDRSFDDFFLLQDDVLSRIVSALEVKLTPDEEQNLARRPTDSKEAYDLYLRALEQESFFTAHSNKSAARYLEEALKIDPEFALALARLSTVQTVEVENGWAPDPVGLTETARLNAQRAMKLDPELPQAHWAMARVHTRRVAFDPEAAINSLNRAIELDPGYSEAYAMLAIAMHYIGRSEQGLAYIETAMRLNPRFPFWYYFALGANQFNLTNYEAALSSYEKAIARNANWLIPHLYIVPAFGHLDRPEDAEWELIELSAMGFESTPANWEDAIKISDPLYRTRFFDGLRKAGILDPPASD